MLIQNINIVSFCNIWFFVVVDCRHEKQTHPAQNETRTADTCDKGPTQDDRYNCHRMKFALCSYLRNLMMLLKRGMVIGYLTFISWQPPQIHLFNVVLFYIVKVVALLSKSEVCQLKLNCYLKVWWHIRRNIWDFRCPYIFDVKTFLIFLYLVCKCPIISIMPPENKNMLIFINFCWWNATKTEFFGPSKTKLVIILLIVYACKYLIVIQILPGL